jgi:uncharacterized protein
MRLASPGEPAIVASRLSSVVLCERCFIADKPLARLRGLLGRATLAPGEGLLVRPAAAIHTCFMRFAIDVVFLDRELRVIGVESNLKPWRGTARRRARAVLELSSGECRRRRIQVGDRLVLLPGGTSGRQAGKTSSTHAEAGAEKRAPKPI